MSTVFVDHEKKRLFGPCSLEEALDAAEADGGVAMAVSVPDEAFIAARFEDCIHVRRVNERSGHGGSQLGTGRWMDGSWVPGRWRPA